MRLQSAPAQSLHINAHSANIFAWLWLQTVQSAGERLPFVWRCSRHCCYLPPCLVTPPIPYCVWLNTLILYSNHNRDRDSELKGHLSLSKWMKQPSITSTCCCHCSIIQSHWDSNWASVSTSLMLPVAEEQRAGRILHYKNYHND